jgi:hypothetical protein
MDERKNPAKDLSRRLQAAIKQVRDDVEKVEFWAEAMSGFSEPVPAYDPNKVKVWLPAEQATALSSDRHSGADAGNKSRSSGQFIASGKSGPKARN